MTLDGSIAGRSGFFTAATTTAAMARLGLLAEVGFIEFVAFEEEGFHVAMGQLIGE